MYGNLLIVDDNVQNLKILKEHFADHEKNLFFANSGQSALKVLDKVEISLILLDMFMPEMSGLETCKKIKGQDKTRHIPVIFLTADTSNQSKLDAFEAGAVDYIIKPFIYEEVIARVNLHMGLVESQNKLQEESQFKMSLLSMATHGLSSDISLVMMNLGISLKALEKGNIDKATTYLKKANDEGANMGNTLLELIAMARNNVINIQPDLSPFNLRILLDDIVAEKSPEFQIPRIKTNYKMCNERFFSDKTFLIHILLNLLHNALTYSPEDSEVNLDVELTPDKLEITVTDYGNGLANENQIELFDQAHRCTDAESIDSDGIGLSLVKQFTESLKGTVSVNSETNKSTSFTVTLPVARQK